MTISTMHSWDTRKAVGDAHEQRVAGELVRRGWTVDPYGQGVLSEVTRRALGHTESTMRWDPDLVASRGGAICLIDAKGSTKGDDAFNYTISRKALAAGRVLWERTDLPLYYVFANLGVATPVEVMQFCRLASIREAPAYVSFSSGMVRPFDDTFGVPPAAGHASLRRAA